LAKKVSTLTTTKWGEREEAKDKEEKASIRCTILHSYSLKLAFPLGRCEEKKREEREKRTHSILTFSLSPHRKERKGKRRRKDEGEESIT